MQVVVGQGDGWVRGYEAMTGRSCGSSTSNPKDSVWPKTRNEVISTPVIYENVVYIANGQDPGARRRRRPSLRDRSRPSAATSRDRHGSGITTRSAARSQPAPIYNGILFYSDFSGFLHALDVKTGKPFWTHDMFAAIWGSPMVIDGKVYLGDEDGDVTVFNADRTMKVIAENNMGSSVYSTPVPAQRRALHRQSQPAVRAGRGSIQIK